MTEPLKKGRRWGDFTPKENQEHIISNDKIYPISLRQELADDINTSNYPLKYIVGEDNGSITAGFHREVVQPEKRYNPRIYNPDGSMGGYQYGLVFKDGGYRSTEKQEFDTYLDVWNKHKESNTPYYLPVLEDDDVYSKLKLEDGVYSGVDTPVEVEKDELVLKKDGNRYSVVADFKGMQSHEDGGVDFDLQKGDIVFPAKYRKSIEKYLSKKDYNSIDELRSTLPKNLPTHRELKNGLDTEEEPPKQMEQMSGIRNFLKSDMERSGVEFNESKVDKILKAYNYDYDSIIADAGKRAKVKDPEKFKTGIYSHFNIVKPDEENLAEISFLQKPLGDGEGYDRYKSLSEDLQLAEAMAQRLKQPQEEIDFTKDLEAVQSTTAMPLPDELVLGDDTLRPEAREARIQEEYKQKRIMDLQDKIGEINKAIAIQAKINKEQLGYTSQEHEEVSNQFDKYDAILNDAITDRERGAVVSTMPMYQGSASGFGGVTVYDKEDQERVENLRNIKELYQKMGKVLGAPQGEGFKAQMDGLLYGFGNNFFTKDFATLGLNEMGRLLNVKEAFDTYKAFQAEGKTEEEINELMPSEQKTLMDTYQQLLSIQAGTQANFGTSIGEGLKEMLPFIAQFAATGGVGASAKKLVKEFVEAKTKSAVAGKIAGTIAKPMVQGALMLPANLQNYAERVAPTMDEKGELVEGQKPLNAAFKAYLTTMAEVAGEDVGSFANKIANKSARRNFAKMIANKPNKAQEFLGKLSLALTQETGVPSVQGFVFEGIGEEATGFMQAMIDQDGSFFTPEAQAQVWVMSLLASGGFSAMSVPNRISTKVRYNKSTNLLNDIPNQDYTDAVQSLTENYDNPEDLLYAFDDVSKEFNASEQDYYKARNFIGSTIQYNQMNTSRAIQLEEKVAKFKGNDGNVTLTKLDGVDYSVRNPQDLGPGNENKIVYLKSQDGSVKPIISSKIKNYETKNPEQIVSEQISQQDVQDEMFEQAQQIQEDAAQRGLIEGNTVNTPHGKRELVSINEDGTATVADTKGETSEVNVSEIEAYKTQEQKDTEKVEEEADLAVMEGIEEGAEVVSDESLTDDSDIRVVDFSNGQSKIITPEGEQTFDTLEQRDAAIKEMVTGEIESTQDNIDEMPPEQAFGLMLQDDAEIATEIFTEEINNIRKQAEEKRAAVAETSSRKQKQALLMEAKQLEGEAQRLDAILQDPTLLEQPIEEEVKPEPSKVQIKQVADQLNTEYQQEQELAPYNQLLPWQQQVLGTQFSKESLLRWADEKTLSQSIARAWVAKKDAQAQNIDTAAQELSELGIEVSPQDIVDFIMDNPSGSVRKTTDRMNEIAKEYRTLTGESIKNHQVPESKTEQVEDVEGSPLGKAPAEIPFRTEEVKLSDNAKKSSKFKNRIVDELNKLQDKFGIPITVIHSSDLSAGAQAKMIETGNVPKAYYQDGTAYIIIDGAEGVADAKRSYMHESILHKGLDVLFNAGPVNILGKSFETKNDLLNEVYSRLSDETLKERADIYFKGIPTDQLTEAQRLELAEEVLATINEIESPLVQTLLDKLYNYIKKLFGFTSKQFSRADLRNLLRDHRKLVMEAKGQVQTKPSASVETKFRATPAGDVNSDNFKKWFGNSEVVDTDGSPLVVYHGTNADFTAFDPQKQTTTAHGYGFYFATDKAIAEGYERGDKGQLIEAFLSIQQPLNDDAPNFSIDEMEDIVSEILNLELEKYADEMESWRDSFLSNMVDTYSVSKEDAISEVANQIVEYNDTANDAIAELSNIVGDRQTTQQAVKNTLGYDGIFVKDFQETDGDVYIAWFPNQVKSATENSGEFSASNDDIRFRILGEKGATALDQYDEATTRLDNLQVARDMQSEGKTPKEIRQSTGWELGVDKKWRYEVDDSDIIFKSIKELPMEEAGGQYYKKAKLSDIIESDNLYEEYPGLKDTDIVLYNFEHPSMTSGQYYAGSKSEYFSNISPSITLWNVDYSKPELSDYKKRVIMHELQHAIQNYEGFPRGGSSSNIKESGRIANPKYTEWLSEENQQAIEEFNELKNSKEYEEELFASNDLFEKDFSNRIDKAYDKLREMPRDERKELQRSNKNPMDLIFREFEELKAQKYPTLTRADELQKAYIIPKPERQLSAYETYNRIAGEVEARNVEKRLGLTKKERQQTLLEETEDVSRKDQVLIEKGIAKSISEQPKFRVAESPKELEDFVKDSKVKETVYHGTDAVFDEFDKEKTGKYHFEGKDGFFFTDKKRSADNYARLASSDDKGVTMSTRLNIQNPLILNSQDYWEAVEKYDRQSATIIDNAKENGHDGIVSKSPSGSLYVAFEPSQILIEPQEDVKFRVETPTVYHGSDQVIDKFDMSKAKGSGKASRNKAGIFFTSDPAFAKSWGDNMNERKLQFNKPLTVDSSDPIVKEVFGEDGFSGNIKAITNRRADKLKEAGFDGVIGFERWTDWQSGERTKSDVYLMFNEEGIVKPSEEVKFRTENTYNSILSKVDENKLNTYFKDNDLSNDDIQDALSGVDNYWINQFLEDEYQISINDNGLVQFDELTDEVRDIIGDNPVLMYHHTSTGVIDDIKVNGLKETGIDVNRQGEAEKGVYLTTQYSGAEVDGYKNNAVQTHGGNPVTLEVETTINDLTPDIDDADITSGRYQFTVDNISPENILNIQDEGVKFRIEEQREQVDNNPSEAQKESGNYKMGHIKIDGFDISIENPKGSIRSGKDADGKRWSNIMPADYGYFKGTIGKDKDHIDVFMGDNMDSDKVYVVDQINEDGSFDEHKVMMGYNSISDARNAYNEAYDEGWQGLGNITRTTKDGLKEWFKGDTTKPFAQRGANVKFRINEDPIAWVLEKSEKAEMFTGEEKSKELSNNIERLTSNTGSVRYIKSDAEGNAISGIQIVTRGDEAFIANVYTLPSERRKGYGYELAMKAKSDYPTLKHSEFLEEDGKKFADAVKFRVQSQDPEVQKMLDKLQAMKKVTKTAEAIKSMKEELPNVFPEMRQTILDQIAAYKAGAKTGFEDAGDMIKNVQSELIKYAKKVLPMTEAGGREIGRILTVIKNSQTIQSLEAAVNEIDIISGVSESKKELRKNTSRVNRLLGWMTGLKKQGAHKVGKFNYADTKEFQELKSVNDEAIKLVKQSNSYKSSAEQKIQAEEGLDKLWNDINEKESKTDLDNAVMKLIELRRLGSKASPALAQIVADELEMIYTNAKDAKSQADLNKAISRREDKDFIESFLTDKQSLKKLPWAKKALTQINTGVADIMGNWETLMTMIGGTELRDKMSFMLNEADMEVGKQQTNDRLLDQAKDIYGNKGKMDTLNKVHELSSPEYELRQPNRKGELGKGEPMELSKLELMDVYNALKNEDVQRDYYMSYGDIILAEDGSRDIEAQMANGKARIDALVDNLSAQDKQFADAMQSELDTYYDKLNEIHIKRYNRDLPRVENYWPSTAERAKDIDVMDQFFVESRHPSATKERSAHRTPIPRDAFNKFTKHVGEAEWYSNMALAVDNANKLLSDVNIKTLIEDARGPKFYKNIEESLQNVTLMPPSKIQQKSKLNDFVNPLLNNWVAAKIGATPSVPLKQLLSSVNYAENMPAGEWAKGFVKGLASPKDTWQEMMKIPYLKTRLGDGYSEAVQRALNGDENVHKSKATNYHQAFKKYMTIGTTYGDITAIIFGGKPYLDYLIEKKGLSEKEAVDKFLQDTLRSQQAPFSSTLSKFQNSKNTFARAIFAFANTPSQYMRKLFEANQNLRVQKEQLDKGNITQEEYNKAKKQTLKAHTIYGLVNTVTFTMAGSLINAMMKGSDIDDEIWKDMLAQLSATYTGGLPIIKDILNTTTKLSLGMKLYDSVQPYIEGLETVVTEGMKIAKGDSKDLAKSYEKVGQGVSDMVGVPYYNIKKSIKALPPFREETIKETRVKETEDKLNKFKDDDYAPKADAAVSIKRAYSKAKSKATKLRKENKNLQADKVEDAIAESKVKLWDTDYSVGDMKQEQKMFESRISNIK